MKKVIIPCLLSLLFLTQLQLAAQIPELIVPIGHTYWVTCVAFSPDGRTILTGSLDQKAKLWDLNGRELHTFDGHGSRVIFVGFSPDGKSVLTADLKDIFLWDLNGQAPRATLETWPDWADRNVVFPKSMGQVEDKLKAWAAAKHPAGQELSRILLGGNSDRKKINALAISPDNSMILTGRRDATADLWNVGGKKLQDFSGHSSYVHTVVFSRDGRQILTGNDDHTAKLWNSTDRTLRVLSGHNESVKAVAFTPDGHTILAATSAAAGKVKAKAWTINDPMPRDLEWEVPEKPEQDSFIVHDDEINSITFSPDSLLILTSSDDKTAKLWSVEGKKLLATFSGHADRVSAAVFSPDGQTILTGSWDNTMKLWKAGNSTELATLIQLDSTNWVVTTPEGRFDASTGAMKIMHYVVFDDGGFEVIELDQLKERYFEPGLLGKLLGFNPEPLRNISPLNKKLDLYPKAAVSINADLAQLTVSLIPRDGGVGRVALYIGALEVEPDLDPGRSNFFQVDMNKYRKFFVPGEPMQVSVEAWDANGALKSQRRSVSFTLPADGLNQPQTPNDKAIRMYALCIGSGDYAGGAGLDLSYAEHDAGQMARALQEAGKAMLPAADLLNVKLLTTCLSCKETPEAEDLPSKINIKKAFEDIAEKARPQDVVVLYFSGHGKTFDDLWHYLTFEMISEDMTDPEVRGNRTISSREIKDWMAGIAAKKKVLMIDACASGKLNQDFDLASQRAISSGQIRTLERLGSRTGLFVIAASTADQASFEASPFGMGLLTYALLQGMQGPSLLDNSIDVIRLFAYAEDQVPKFADYIRRKQKPMIYAPVGAESFPIGFITPQVRGQLRLPDPKPLFSMALFGDPEQFNDDRLQLSDQVNAALRDLNTRKERSPLVFVETYDLPQSYRLRGAYSLSGGTVKVNAAVFRDAIQIGDAISLAVPKDQLEALGKKLVEEALLRVQAFMKK